MTANQVQIRCKIRWCSTRVLPRIYRVLTRNHRVLPRNYRVLPSTFSSVDSVIEFLPGTQLPFSQHWCSTYCLSCSGSYLNLLTSRRILTAHLHVLEGIKQGKQWVVIGSATNATKEAVVTRTILANLTYAQKEITTNPPHAIPALFSIIPQLTNTCQPC